MGLTNQPRLRVAVLPTPLQYAERLSEALGGPEIYLKRDDLTGLAFGGNKTRKLEYLVGDAIERGATHLITTGGVQSNHARQTVAAANLAGMQAVLVLSTDEHDPPLQGNLLVDRLLGGNVHYVSTREERHPKMEEIAADLTDSGAVPYIIPGGGSNGVGALGYVAAMLELNQQVLDVGIAPKAMYFASGGGGTHGGIALGATLYSAEYDAIGVMIEDTADEGVERAYRVAEWTAERMGIDNPVRRSDVICNDHHVGEGYGIPTDEGLEAIGLLAHTESVLLDPVYTAKAFAGMIADIRAGVYAGSDSVIFLHTGGTPALFAMTDTLGQLMG